MDIKADDTEQTYSFEEYLAMEAKAEYKSEYHGGKVVAMAGFPLRGDFKTSILY